MKITLKNMKHAAFASEDSVCFEATLYLDNERVGIVSNDGRGGPMKFDNLPGKNRSEMLAKLRAAAKAINPNAVDMHDDLPPRDSYELNFDDPDWWKTSPMTWLGVMDIAVGEALNEALLAKQLKNELRTRYLVAATDGKLKEFKKKQRAFEHACGDQEKINELIQQVVPGLVLNFAPFDDALDHYKRALK